MQTVRSCIATVCLTFGLAAAIPNGVGLTPDMGFNSWYAFHSHLTYPGYRWEPGFVLADALKEVAGVMRGAGLVSAGYDYLDLDDCIVVGRDANGTLIPDPQAFPRGLLSLSSWAHANGFKLGAYTDRGVYTCSCWAGGLKRPGSYMHEKLDASWYAANGVDALKEDSCNVPSGAPGPMQQYAIMRDALNATGRPVFFNLCYPSASDASTARSVGNEWRIAEDDGGGWGPILVNVNADAPLGEFSGCVPTPEGVSCGFNDPGLLLVGSPELSAAQSRSHMGLWAILAAKLLISVDPRNMTAADFALLTNKEVIAIDQDGLTQQGARLLPKARASPALATAAMPHVPGFLRGAAPASFSRTAARLASAHAGPEAAARLPATHARKYLSVAWEHLRRSGNADRANTERAELSAAYEADARAAGLMAPPGGQSEVWARNLTGGDVAVLFFNNNQTAPADIACASGCWAGLGLAPGQTVNVRDVFAQKPLPQAHGSVAASGVAKDDSVLLRLSPA